MNANVKPRFEIEKLEGKRTRTIANPKIETYSEDIPAKDSDGEVIMKSNKPVLLHKAGAPVLDDKGKKVSLGGFDYTAIEVDAGWMVYFPRGASIHVWTREEMERLGFLADPTLVDMDTGDVVGPMADTSLKAGVERVANRPRTSRATQI